MEHFEKHTQQFQRNDGEFWNFELKRRTHEQKTTFSKCSIISEELNCFDNMRLLEISKV